MVAVRSFSSCALFSLSQQPKIIDYSREARAELTVNKDQLIRVAMDCGFSRWRPSGNVRLQCCFSAQSVSCVMKLKVANVAQILF